MASKKLPSGPAGLRVISYRPDQSRQVSASPLDWHPRERKQGHVPSVPSQNKLPHLEKLKESSFLPRPRFHQHGWVGWKQVDPLTQLLVRPRRKERGAQTTMRGDTGGRPANRLREGGWRRSQRHQEASARSLRIPGSFISSERPRPAGEWKEPLLSSPRRPCIFFTRDK